MPGPPPSQRALPIRGPLPANGGANMPTTGCGVAFASGIGIRITTGPGDSDTGAASTNDVLVNLDYA